MHHLNLMKIGFTVLTAAAGHASASPSEFALEMVKRLAAKKLKRPHPEEKHCDVCHEANVRLLARAA